MSRLPFELPLVYCHVPSIDCEELSRLPTLAQSVWCARSHTHRLATTAERPSTVALVQAVKAAPVGPLVGRRTYGGKEAYVDSSTSVASANHALIRWIVREPVLSCAHNYRQSVGVRHDRLDFLDLAGLAHFLEGYDPDACDRCWYHSRYYHPTVNGHRCALLAVPLVAH